MSFSVIDEAGDFEYSSVSINGVFAKRAHLVTPWFHGMLTDLVRFQREARELLDDDATGPSLGDWLEDRRYSRPFIDQLIVPQAAAVWSADPRQMWTFPARFLAEFFTTTGCSGCATVRAGARSSVARGATSGHWRGRWVHGCCCRRRSVRSAATTPM